MVDRSVVQKNLAGAKAEPDEVLPEPLPPGVPRPTGRAWADAHASTVRDTVGWIYRHATDLLDQIAKLGLLTDQEVVLAPQVQAAEALRRWSDDLVHQAGVSTGELPRSAHAFDRRGPRRALRRYDATRYR
ncbi:MAG: hypothetical protein L3K23_10420 [Thermoplasmata archaeon]|nr:hypothetical protein [Thermoplasmata archaeon]